MSENPSQSHLQLLPSLVKGAGVNFMGQAGSIVLNAVFGLLVAQQYGIKITGIFFLAYSIILFLQFLIKMGLHHAAVRYVSMYFNKDSENFRKYLQNIFFLNFLLSVPVSIIAYAAAPLMGSILDKPDVGVLLRGLTAFLFLSSISQTMAASTRGTGKMAFSSITLLSDIVTRIIAFIVVSFFVKGDPLQVIWLSFLAGGVASFCTSVIFVAISFNNIFKGFSTDTKTIGKILKFSSPQGFADMVSNLYQVSPLYLLGYFAASEDVGLMGAATRITNLGTMFLIAFNTVFAPYISKLYHSGELSKLEELYKTMTYWVFGSSFAFFVFLLINPLEFMGFFGSDFKAGSDVLVILTVGQIINCVTGCVGYMLVMSGRTKTTLVNNSLAFVIVIGLGIILIPKYGAIGAALSYSISIALVNFLRSYEIYKIFGFHGFSIRMTKVFYAATSSGLFLLFIKSVIDNQNYANFAISITAALLIYLLSFRIIGLTREDFTVIEAAKKSLSRNEAND